MLDANNSSLTLSLLRTPTRSRYIRNATFLIALNTVFTGANAQLGSLFSRKPAPAASAPAAVPPPALCDKPVYLTLDTGHMEVAQFMADTLNKHNVKVTFFVANEKTKDDSTSMSKSWGEKFWAARGKEGHEFASHTWDHPILKGDAAGNEVRFIVQPTQGAFAGRTFTWEPKKYCEQLDFAKERIEYYTGKKSLPLFRAPGGRTSAKLLAAAQACGYKHVGWSPAGFMGDELPSERVSNDALLKKALRDIQPGDILMAHLGIWSRKDPWAPAVLEPLIVGLKDKGFCFNTLRQHPDFKEWIATNGG
jgi:peptidoglycan/xylan/chitin deacetylase (PgdA/CDA1 family)